MHQLLKGAGHKTCASPFPWLKDELKILEAAGFHDIKVHPTSYICDVYICSSHPYQATLGHPQTVLASIEL